MSAVPQLDETPIAYNAERPSPFRHQVPVLNVHEDSGQILSRQVHDRRRDNMGRAQSIGQPFAQELRQWIAVWLDLLK